MNKPLSEIAAMQATKDNTLEIYLLVDVHTDAAPWALKIEDAVVERGLAKCLEEVRSIQLAKGVERVLIDGTFHAQEVAEAAYEYGWEVYKGRAPERREIEDATDSNAHFPKPTAPRRRSVVQAWVTQTLSMMQQTVLLTAVRGPDGLRKESPAKPLLRAYRRDILLSATDGRILSDPTEDGGGSFTGPCTHPEGLAGVMRDFIRGTDEYPHHFLMHVIHAVEILGYKHCDLEKRELWNWFYLALCNDAHMEPESEERLDFRLGDSREQWLETQNTPLGAIVQ